MKSESRVAARYSKTLFAEEVKLLYQNAPLAYAVSLVNGAILVLTQRTYIPTPRLLTWYGALALVTALRGAALWRYRRSNQPHVDPRHWNNLYCAGTALAGVVWGSTALALFPGESIAHQAFVAFILAGMAAGSVSVLAPRIESCLVFLLPSLLPLAIQYFTLDAPVQRVMGIMTLIFLVAMFLSALNFHRSIHTSLSLRFDKRELEDEVTLRRRAEEALFREKERLQTTLSSIGEGVALVDAMGRIEYLNPAAEQLCGWSLPEARNRPAHEVFKSIDIHEQRVSTAMEDSLHSTEQVTKQNVLLCKAGKKHFIEELATPLYDRHRLLVGAVSVFRDVTEALQKTEQLAYAADHDPLTGLPNRNLLKDRTRQAIARAQRKHETFALLFLDLDRFKAVNDELGHASGDALLVDVAKRLTGCVREEDTIARLGGDEFVILLDGPTQKKQVEAVADKIGQALREPYQLGSQRATVSVSIGSSLFPLDGQDAETLLGHADVAMYRAKRRGGNRMNR